MFLLQLVKYLINNLTTCDPYFALTYNDNVDSHDRTNNEDNSNNSISLSCFACFAALNRIMQTGDEDLQGACSSALFQIHGNVGDPSSPIIPATAPPSYEEAIAEPNLSSASASAQVMVSYQWDSQTRAIMIKEKLLAAGYKVWMDLTNMRKFLHSNILMTSLIFLEVLRGYCKLDQLYSNFGLQVSLSPVD